MKQKSSQAKAVFDIHSTRHGEEVNNDREYIVLSVAAQATKRQATLSHTWLANVAAADFVPGFRDTTINALQIWPAVVLGPAPAALPPG